MTIAKLDKLLVQLEQFGGKKSVAPENLPESEAVKLANLVATGRNFLDETDALKTAIVARVKASLVRGVIDAAAWDREVAKAVKEHVVARWGKQGGDVTLAPLKASTLAIKRRKGQSLRIGEATGDLLRALKAAVWSTRKR